MATHSSILTWEIPRTEEPGGQQSMGSQKIGCDWAPTTKTIMCVNEGIAKSDAYFPKYQVNNKYITINPAWIMFVFLYQCKG